MAARRDALSPAEIDRRSEAVCERLFAYKHFIRSKTIMVFVSFRSEVRTLPIIRRAIAEGKRVTVPLIIRGAWDMVPCEITAPDADLAPGAYGILEPAPERRKPVEPGELDFVCFPGLGFTRKGWRLGYGGGYYDGFERLLSAGAYRAALAFDFQVIDELPHDPAQDRRVRFIITESEIINCYSQPPALPL